MVDLKGIMGVFYFPDGWFGKAWDNFYKIDEASEVEKHLKLGGRNWTLAGPINGIAVLEDSVLLDFETFEFTFQGKPVSWNNNRDPILFYSGDEYIDLG